MHFQKTNLTYWTKKMPVSNPATPHSEKKLGGTCDELTGYL